MPSYRSSPKSQAVTVCKKCRLVFLEEWFYWLTFSMVAIFHEYFFGRSSAVPDLEGRMVYVTGRKIAGLVLLAGIGV